MSRPKTRKPEIVPLKITLELLQQLDTLSVPERRALFERAQVPLTSYFDWRNGHYHPGLPALDRLAQAIGYEVCLAVKTPASQ